MKKLSKRTALVAVATAAATTLAGGFAFAFWTANGTGSAAAQATTVTGVSGAVATIVTQSPALLYPGGPAVTAVVNVHNTNASVPVKVTAISVATAATPVSVTGGTGCTAANSAVSLAAGSLSSLTTVIPGGGDATFNLGQVTMGSASDNGCQGATFKFDAPVTAQVG